MTRKFGSQIVLVIATLAAIAGAVLLLVRSSSSGGMEIVLPTATPDVQARPRVHISGAVIRPGVYEVRNGDRLVDVIEAAGGATEDVDLAAVNLAARVEDEDHWHIPRLGEEPREPSAQSGEASGRIDVNSADEELLKTLPGIGEVKARAIIRFRDTNGPVSSVEELLEVPGIGPATLDAIRDLIDTR